MRHRQGKRPPRAGRALSRYLRCWTVHAYPERWSTRAPGHKEAVLRPKTARALDGQTGPELVGAPCSPGAACPADTAQCAHLHRYEPLCAQSFEALWKYCNGMWPQTCHHMHAHGQSGWEHTMSTLLHMPDEANAMHHTAWIHRPTSHVGSAEEDDSEELHDDNQAHAICCMRRPRPFR